MLTTTLAKLVPFALTANALFFEPPSGKRHAAPVRRALAVRDPAPGANWVKLGCYIDTITPRTLTGSQTASDTIMTNAYCQQYCSAHGYTIAGTEWSKECFCDNTLDNTLLTSDADCDMSCSGAPEVCGGGARLTVWQNQGTVSEPGHETIGDWTGQGCYVDSVTSRALPTQIQIDGVTVEKCTAACFAGGFQYAGVEYGSECYCANVIATDSGNVGTPANDGCTMSCAGNAAEICGGGNRLNIYSYTGSSLPAGPTQVPTVGDWSLKGCYSDDVANRALPVRQAVDGAMTVEKCTAKCLSQGYKFSGLEYANECYCSNEIGTYPNSGALETDGCVMPCEGAPNTEICGGSNRLTLYEYTGTGLGTAPTVLDSYNDFESKGCYVDSVNARVLTVTTTAVTPMTVGNCVDACVAAGFTVAGVEYASECYCGNALPPVAATEGCVMKCDGDAAHLCGGPDRLNVYEKTIVAPPQTFNYRIKVTDARPEKNDALIGYIAQALGNYVLPAYTTDVTLAAQYEIQGPATPGGTVDLHQLNAPDQNHQYLGPYDGTANYQILGTISQTAPGATKQPTGSTRSMYSQGESCVWSVDAITNKLSAIWVKDDGTAVPTSPFKYGDAPNQYFMHAINAATLQAQFGSSAVPVTFTLDAVPTTPTRN